MQTRRQWTLLLFAAILVSVVSITSNQRLPLYDGVGLPDEPYRYVHPPKDSLKTAQSPTNVEQLFLVENAGNTNYMMVVSQENGPQVQAYVEMQALQVTTPLGKTSATVHIIPKAPDTNNQQIVGNIYELSATSPSGSVSLISTKENSTSLSLRLPQGYPVGATILYRQTAHEAWVAKKTDRTGNDIYSTQLVGFGEYAIVSSPVDKAATTSTLPSNFIPIVAVSVVCIGILVIRIRLKRPKNGHVR